MRCFLIHTPRPASHFRLTSWDASEIRIIFAAIHEWFSSDFFKKVFHFTILIQEPESKNRPFKEIMHNHGPKTPLHWARHRKRFEYAQYFLRRYPRDDAGTGEPDTLIKDKFWFQTTWGFFWKFSTIEMYNGTVLLTQILLRITIDSVFPLYFKLEDVRPVCHTGKL